MTRYRELAPPPRTIMTPGPVEADPRVLRAMSYPMLGQFDPAFTALMNETMEMLRALFATANGWAYPVDGTSRSGLEAALAALIEPGERVLVPIFGRFGHLLHEIALRYGAEVSVIEQEWGRVFDPQQVIEAIDRVRPAVVALVHGETSTGQLQPLREIGAACRSRGVLLVVDAVATIGGVPVETDAWQLDAVVGGTQKCLSVPPGMAPLTYNDAAERKLLARRRIERGLRTPEGGEAQAARQIADAQAGMLPRERHIRSNYLDLSQLQDYWSPARLNHHTEMTSMLYGLREGVRLALEEGLAARHARHLLHGGALAAGLEAMGLQLYGERVSRLPVVACVRIPDGIDGEAVRALLLEQFGIEIASSFGPLKGMIWRIGTMGYSCSRRNVLLTLGALEAALLRHGLRLPAGEAVQTALQYYTRSEGI
ncbi:alanine--glyoxylate aminotransferase family protein [Paenibacillus sp. IB182496]|uniref:Alanine--glyoxylate aminotransferase family protein n=1 Tax=Paenibacillus sabuli TaxID=2772509 RepID=A0A927C030_9BACL|nr:alanine--glyoxylate aminotransferase family protein [Paenibacillus sabuli]MBD2848529.1 alanine--glyoxylate aminotransferase family protein [Paenibacillus sabuli]